MKKDKCHDCGDNVKLKRIHLFNNDKDAKENKNGFYIWVCEDCECSYAEAEL